MYLHTKRTSWGGYGQTCVRKGEERHTVLITLSGLIQNPAMFALIVLKTDELMSFDSPGDSFETMYDANQSNHDQNCVN
jgi:hypothetical protein